MRKSFTGKSTFLATLFFLAFLMSCKKPEGVGGDASIHGTVWVEDYDKNFNLLMYQYPGVDEYVYIVYGDDLSYGDRVKTNYNGTVEFKYLRTGDYKVYVYGDQKQSVDTPSPLVAHVVDVHISGRTQSVDVDTIVIQH
jgi:hypothetical protein